MRRQARSHGGKGLGRGRFKPPTRLKDDSWDLPKSDEIFLHSGMASVTALKKTASSMKPSGF